MKPRLAGWGYGLDPRLPFNSGWNPPSLKLGRRLSHPNADRPPVPFSDSLQGQTSFPTIARERILEHLSTKNPGRCPQTYKGNRRNSEDIVDVSRALLGRERGMLPTGLANPALANCSEDRHSRVPSCRLRTMDLQLLLIHSGSSRRGLFAMAGGEECKSSICFKSFQATLLCELY